MKKTLLLVAMMALVSAIAFAGNLIPFGDMESGSATSWMEEGSTLKYDVGKGINGSTALLVKNTDTWSGVGVDVTKVIDKTKSYYIECWIKLSTKPKAAVKGSITLEFRPKDIADYGEDWMGYYYLTPGIDFDYEAKEVTGSEIPVNPNEWVKISGVVRPEDMETPTDSQGVEITSPISGITCYFKIDPAKGMKYWVDNVVIEEIPNID